jgi:LruC domain-containing protein
MKIVVKELILSGLLLLTIVSCVKNNIPYTPEVPDNFDWSMTKSVSVSVEAPSLAATYSSMPTSVRIFTSPTYSDNKLIASGSAYSGKPFNLNIDLPKSFNDSLFVEVIRPDGMISHKLYLVKGTKSEEVSRGVKTKSAAQKISNGDIPRPYIPSDFSNATIITSANYKTVSMAGGNSYYLNSGTTISSRETSSNMLSVSSSKLSGKDNPIIYVAGSVTFYNLMSISNVTIVVLNGGEVTFNRGFYGSSYSNYNSVMIYVAEGGTLNLAGSPQMKNSTSLINDGTITLGTSYYDFSILRAGSGDKIYNGAKGRIISEEVYSNYGSYLYMETGSYLYNFNSIDTPDITLYASSNSLIDNYGYLAVGSISGYNATINMAPGSLITADKMLWCQGLIFYMDQLSILAVNQFNNNNSISNSFINYSSDPALIFMGFAEDDDELEQDSNSSNPRNDTFQGNIEIYAPMFNNNKINTYNNNNCFYGAFFTRTRTNHIPRSKYNKGYGMLHEDIIDADGDGVPSDIDIDDNDPDVAYVSYFPSNGGSGTFIFEDLWSWTGDYDMNDAVIDFRVIYYTNSANMVTKIDYEWSLRAVGASLKISSAVQLDAIAPSSINYVYYSNLSNMGTAPINRSSNGLESGQSKAVFTLFNDPSEVFGQGNSTFINTYTTKDYIQPNWNYVRIKFASPIPIANVSISKINTFIVVSPSTNNPQRGKEVHLADYTFTDLMDKSYLTGGLQSKENPYKVVNGMVWAYMFPSRFRYPQESVNLCNVYLRYKDWYSSGGTLYQDWYDTSKSGYVDSSWMY